VGVASVGAWPTSTIRAEAAAGAAAQASATQAATRLGRGALSGIPAFNTRST
jgi:hypothetical protein